MQKQYQHSVHQPEGPLGAGWWLVPFLALFLIFVVAGAIFLTQNFIREQVEVPTRVETAHLPTAPVVAAAPMITIAPQTGAPGTLVTVTGQGWRPSDKLVICLDDLGDMGVPPVYAETEADENGRFNVAFIFPTQVAWKSLPVIPVVVESTSQPVKVSAAFTLSPATPTLIPTVPTVATATIVPTLTPTPTETPFIPTNTPVPPTATAVPPTPIPLPPTNTPPPPATATQIPGIWRGEFFANMGLSGAPGVVADVTSVNYYWGNDAPGAGIPADLFSARFTGNFNFTVGSYSFYARADDGVRLWVDGLLLINQWHDSNGNVYQGDLFLSSGYHNVRVEYYENTGTAQLQVWWEQPGGFPEWRGEYWTNRNFYGQPQVIRNDRELNFNWGAGSPAAGIPSDGFSARWTRSLSFSEGAYRFHLLVDDGARLFVDGVMLVDEWRDGGARERMAGRWLNGGTHTIQVDYYENTGNAVVGLWWEKEPEGYPDWRGEYWSNSSLAGLPTVVRNDQKIDFDWGFNSPDANLPADNFSVRWTRKIDFGNSGLYRFYAQADDGVRIFVDGERVLNHWQDSSGHTTYSADRFLGGQHTVVVEYYDHLHTAAVRVWFEEIEPTLTPTAPPPTFTPIPTAPPAPTKSGVVLKV